ncbi:MAG: hypothetical protein ACRDBY_09485 [Cetobacterium sp.]
MEFRINDFGELEKSNLTITYSDEYIHQYVKNILKSIDTDWYYDNIGSNLEVFFGDFVTEEKTELIKDRIMKSLTKNGIVTVNNLYVDVSIDNMSAYIGVHVRSVENTSESITIKFTLDLFNGLLEGEL